MRTLEERVEDVKLTVNFRTDIKQTDEGKDIYSSVRKGWDSRLWQKGENGIELK